MIKFYILKMGDRIRERGKTPEYLKDLLFKLTEVDVRMAVIFLQDDAIYFKKNNVSTLICTNRENIGAAKIFAKKLIRESKKIDLSSIDDVFRFAEELEKMDLDGIAKFLR